MSEPKTPITRAKLAAVFNDTEELLSMTNDEVRAELVAAGQDPNELIRQMQVRFGKELAAVRQPVAEQRLARGRALYERVLPIVARLRVHLTTPDPTPEDTEMWMDRDRLPGFHRELVLAFNRADNLSAVDRAAIEADLRILQELEAELDESRPHDR